ncbi:hypothetical protein EUGRSUZ_A02524 [Eucalyptus grandis]|uniref:Rx N-terminal domain-containing protein n=2 Tax=Eucalyptus grandis TaxID=71139 RepID=A0A059DIU3_EUCGR|nr:hypothetical protein EUGRSUZ_A02524 [Eucalyptus grandis]
MTEVVSSILGPLLQKLASSTVEEIQLVWGVKDELEKLKSTLEMIQKVLADAEQKQTEKEAVRLWLLKLKDFHYDAEDVLDEFVTNTLCGRQEKIKFNLSSDIYEKAMVPRRETYSFVHTSKIIGMVEEKERIIELLKRSDDGGVGIVVIPILGIGDNKFWLSMPIQFNVEKIIRDMVKALDKKKKDDILEMQQNYLISRVENKRCLFVIDDVWQVTREEWVQLTDLLGGVSKGSKIIVTSRYISITSIMGTRYSFDLANLSREDSLTLFVNCAFDQGKEKNHPDLMVIGKEIVRKCGGNPLVVKTLGSLLYSKHNQKSDWEYCFAYCSIFPKNYVFENFELIGMWISNGFIQSGRNNREREEIGRQYLEELLSRSFFDVVKEDYPVLALKMHDLIHDLAISVAQTESCSMTKKRTQDISPSTQHISFFNTFDVPKDEVRGCLSKLSRVRTVVFEKLGSSEEFFLETCIGRFKHLRVLLLNESTFDLLPSSIGSLKYLRTLQLYDSFNLKKLPKSVWKLRNLQCLGLSGCRELEELPADIKNMIILRALAITTKQQRFPESGIGCLTSLRWLYIGECENLETLFDDIQSLTSLRLLAITSCPKLASLPQGIKNLPALEHLWTVDCERLRLPEGEKGIRGIATIHNDFSSSDEEEGPISWVENSD